MTTRPLSHVRVLDFGQYLAGPMVGMMLADMGAEVIRIDPPGGPRWTDPAFDMLSRGKRSLVLDLKTDAGRDTALDMAARAGQFTDMVLNRQLMAINPSFTPLGRASAYGAAFGAMAVLFALGAKGRMRGDHVEVPPASALFEGLVYNCEQIEDYPARYRRGASARDGGGALSGPADGITSCTRDSQPRQDRTGLS